MTEPVIDSHFHLWPDGAPVGRLAAAVGFDHGVAWEDYAAAIAGQGIEASVAVEVDIGDPLAEVAFFEAAADSAMVPGIVAHAPLERDDIEPLLSRLAARPRVRGVRRVTQNEADPEFCARPAFRANVARLGALGLSCDLCVKGHQLAGVEALARACPGTVLILDHLGKPEPGAVAFEAWRDALARLAERPNVYCKMSVIVHGTADDAWDAERVAPLVAHAIDCFGYERLMFASNWPVSLAVTGYGDWLTLARALTGDARPEQRARLFRDTAIEAYRLAPVS